MSESEVTVTLSTNTTQLIEGMTALVMAAAEYAAMADMEGEAGGYTANVIGVQPFATYLDHAETIVAQAKADGLLIEDEAGGGGVT